MAEDSIRPSGDVMAAALIVAGKIVMNPNGLHDDSGNRPRGDDRKRVARETADFIGELAKRLCDAVKD
jgi:hypothetical protein